MRSSLWDIQERKKLIVSSIEMFKNVLKRKRTQLIVQEAVQIPYNINNLQKENRPRAGVVWTGQVDGDGGWFKGHIPGQGKSMAKIWKEA